MLQRMVVLMIGALALIGMGCGGGGGDSSDGGQSSEAKTAAVTKAVFVRRADHVCTKFNAEVGAGLVAFRRENGLKNQQRLNRQQLVKFTYATVLPQLKAELEGIEALKVPKGDEAQIATMLDVFEQASNKVEADVGLLFTPKTNPLFRASRLARDYGFGVCGAK